MKTSDLVKIYLGVALGLVGVCVVLPFMISSGNESIFAIGVVVLFLLGLGASVLINNTIKKMNGRK